MSPTAGGQEQQHLRPDVYGEPRLGIFFSSMIGLQGHFLPFSVGSVSSDLCVSKRGCAVHFLWGMDLRDTKKVAIVSNTL